MLRLKKKHLIFGSSLKPENNIFVDLMVYYYIYALIDALLNLKNVSNIKWSMSDHW